MFAPVRSALGMAIVVTILNQSFVAAAEGAKAALEEPTTCKFVSMPLRDVAAFFSDKHNVKVVLAEGVQKDVPVSGESENEKLGDALRKLLGPLKLTYAAKADEITISPNTLAK